MIPMMVREAPIAAVYLTPITFISRELNGTAKVDHHMWLTCMLFKNVFLIQINYIAGEYIDWWIDCRLPPLANWISWKFELYKRAGKREQLVLSFLVRWAKAQCTFLYWLTWQPFCMHNNTTSSSKSDWKYTYLKTGIYQAVLTRWHLFWLALLRNALGKCQQKLQVWSMRSWFRQIGWEL